MNLIILGGFLGSGKTSVLLKLAKAITERDTSGKETKLVIIENEIGEIGVDNLLLRSDKYEVSNLFSGCACCSMAGEVIDNIRTVMKDFSPNYIIIESSGVGYPATIRDNIEKKLGLKGTVCTVVDASRWLVILKPMEMILTDQIEGTDIALVNKTDLVDDETLKEVDKSVSGLVPEAKLFNISAVNGIQEEVLSALGIQG